MGRVTKYDMVGRVFGRLTVIKIAGKDRHRNALLLCKCECGNETTVMMTHLNSGHTKSCGCYNAELSAMRHTTHGLGYKYHSEYETWKAMRMRCNNPNDKAYVYYGGRGIKVCERWSKFENFIADMGARPSSEHSIDRYPDNDGDYEQSNCRWGTDEQQRRNRSDNQWYESNGMKMIQADWARYFNVDSSTLISQLKTKTFDEAFEFYAKKKNSTTHKQPT